jgi:hypothetical protein
MKSSLLILLVIICAISSVHAQEKIVTAIEVRYKLCEYLLACQAMAHTVIGEDDFQMKRYLGRTGLDYYGKAYQEYIELQSPKYGILNEELRKNISAVLGIYAKMYNDVTFLNTANGLLAISFIDNIYEKNVLPGLWDKKPAKNKYR